MTEEETQQLRQDDDDDSRSRNLPEDSSSIRRRVHSAEYNGLETSDSNPTNSSPEQPEDFSSPYHDYYQRLHQWIWNYQWYRFCWEQQQREWRDRLFWQQWSFGQGHNGSQGNTGSGIPGAQGPPQVIPPTNHNLRNNGAGAPAVQVQRVQGNPLNIPLAANGHPQIFVGAVGPNNQVDPSWKGFKMAPIWKRVAAEIIDIFLLMLLKIFLTYFLFDEVFFVDFKKYQDLLDPDVEMNAELAMDLASELVVMEFAHRMISCFYETWMTVHGFSQAGATFGKRFMGLRIVTCKEFILLDGMILVKPAEIPSLKNALLRAFFKNYSWAIVVPLPLSVFLNRERRAIYDSMSKCIVVEAGNTMLHRFLR